MTSTWVERNWKFMGDPNAVIWWQGHLTGRKDFCLQNVGSCTVCISIPCKIHDQHGSCACCAAWWHSFTQRKAKQTIQSSQQPGTLLAIKGPRREIFRCLGCVQQRGDRQLLPQLSLVTMCLRTWTRWVGHGRFWLPMSLQAGAGQELQPPLPWHLWKQDLRRCQRRTQASQASPQLSSSCGIFLEPSFDLCCLSCLWDLEAEGQRRTQK